MLVSADPLVRLHLTQERIDLHAELVRITNGADHDLSSYEKDFVRVAKHYGEVAGITYAAWRQVGVDTEVLDQAGIQRTAPARPDASRVRRTTEPGAENEPLLPRTDAIPEPPAAQPDAPAAPTPSAPTAVAPELALEPPGPDRTVVEAASPAKPRPPKQPKPRPEAGAKQAAPKPAGATKAVGPKAAGPKAAAPKALPDDETITPPHGDRDTHDEQPNKLRRKRIAD